MQTQISPVDLHTLRRTAADLRAEIIDTKIELEACPDERDADGCAFDCAYGDLCDALDSLEARLEEIEEQIELETEERATRRGALLTLRFDLQLTLRQPQHQTDTFARRKIEAQLREVDAEIDTL